MGFVSGLYLVMIGRGHMPDTACIHLRNTDRSGRVNP
jgi:hypothetical protein